MSCPGLYSAWRSRLAIADGRPGPAAQPVSMLLDEKPWPKVATCCSAATVWPVATVGVTALRRRRHCDPGKDRRALGS